MRKLNKDQRRLLAEFSSGLSIAWFAGGVISSLFVEKEDMVKLGWQISGSLVMSGFLLYYALKLLEKKRRKIK